MEVFDLASPESETEFEMELELESKQLFTSGEVEMDRVFFLLPIFDDEALGFKGHWDLWGGFYRGEVLEFPAF